MPRDIPSIPLSKIPLISSDRVIRAIMRLGCYQGETRRGSHVSYHRRRDDGEILTTVVIIGKREMARKTLRGILYGLEIPLADFVKALR